MLIRTSDIDKLLVRLEITMPDKSSHRVMEEQLYHKLANLRDRPKLGALQQYKSSHRVIEEQLYHKGDNLGDQRKLGDLQQYK